MTKIKEDLGKTPYQMEGGAIGYLEDIDWSQYPKLTPLEKADMEELIDGPPTLDDVQGIEDLLYNQYPYNLQDYWDTKPGNFRRSESIKRKTSMSKPRYKAIFK